jgi:hypothetical protein
VRSTFSSCSTLHVVLLTLHRMSQQQGGTFEFVLLDADSRVRVNSDTCVTIGRLQCDPHDTRISRQHVTAHCTAAGVSITANKPAYIQASGASVQTLPPGQTTQVKLDPNRGQSMSVKQQVWLYSTH